MATPRPKFGEKGHAGESMGAYRKRVSVWESAKPGGREVAKGYVPPAESVTVGREATKSRRLRAGSVAEFQRQRHEAAKPKVHTSPRGTAVRNLLNAKRKRKAAAAASPTPTPEEKE